MSNYESIDPAVLEEYKLCRSTTEGLDRNIWQTASIFAIGSAAGLVAVLKELPMSNNYYAFGSFIIGLLVIGMLWTWYRLAVRWDSVKNAMILRMERIEKKSILRANLYVRYLNTYKQLKKKKDEEKKKLSELEMLIGEEAIQMLITVGAS